MKCINGVKDIPPILILTGTQQFAFWFNNNLNNNIAVINAETGFTNDWISLQKVKHFEKFSAAHQKSVWRLLLMDGHRSHHTYKFFKFCENHRIKPIGMPPHIIHLLQLLDVCVFQPLKHWYFEAVNEAVQNSNKIFSKIEFLNFFNSFCCKAFKETTIRSSWKQTSLIPYNPKLMADKICSAQVFTRDTAAFSVSVWLPLEQTPVTVKNMCESIFNQLVCAPLPEKLCQTWSKFAKSACQAV